MAARAWRAAGVLVLGAALGGLVWWGSRPAAPQYESAAAARGDVQVTVDAIGTLQPRRYVDVGAQVSGQILRLFVQPGDVVKKGQLLIEIDPSVQQAIVDGGRAALAGLRAQLAEQQALQVLAQQRLARQRQMERDDATRPEDVQTAEAEAAATAARTERLQAHIAQTRASLQADEARLGYTRIYAPMAGTVVSVDAREGQTLNATYQTPNVLRIADLSTMTVWTDVSEADIARVQAGMPVSFATLGAHVAEAGAGGGLGARRWSSTVRQVLPAPPTLEGKAAGGAASTQAAAAKAVAYTVLFDVDNADGALLPQMTAQARFVTATARGAITVPLSAVSIAPADEGGTSQVRVLLADGRVEPRAVRIGMKSRHQAEVLEGVAEGERVVTGERPAERGTRWFKL